MHGDWCTCCTLNCTATPLTPLSLSLQFDSAAAATEQQQCGSATIHQQAVGLIAPAVLLVLSSGLTWASSLAACLVLLLLVCSGRNDAPDAALASFHAETPAVFLCFAKCDM